MSQVMEHVQQLAGVIGPRPAATDAEAQAADYIEDVFRMRGLDVERQEFDCPRTYSWAYVIYNLLTLGAAALSIWWGVPALALAVISAALMWLDLDTRFSIARFLGTGPSQNVIARHIPRQRRGERLRRVVIVAHYDSAKPSLVFSPGLVKNVRTLLSAMKWTTLATPVVVAFGLLPFAAEWRPYTGYAACAVAAYLLFPLVVNVHRELVMHATDGANDNASGVAAMLSVMEATVPEPDDSQPRDRPRRRGADVAFEAGVAPEDALLEYRAVGGATTPSAEPAALDSFGDVDWETGKLEPVSAPEAGPAPVVPAPAVLSSDWTEDAGIGSLWDESEAEVAAPSAAAWREPRAATPRPVPAPVPVSWEAKSTLPSRAAEEDVAAGQERLKFETGADEGTHEPHGISAWLGIGRGFDVRKAGKRIGTWDNIESEDEDEFGFKAGTAGDFDTEEAGFANDTAARIRRRVTENVDRALSEKEIWFVATGADEAGMWGMRALIAEYGDDLKDALIINIDSVGTGSVAFLTEEGVTRSHHADRRLVTQAKRTAREGGLAVKARSYKGLATGITPALSRHFKAMSVMAFDINGRRPNWHWHTDTVENVASQTVEQAATFVTALLRDL